MANTVCECSVSNLLISLGIASFTILDSSQGLKVGGHVSCTAFESWKILC